MLRQYLDLDGLAYLWSKIKATFVSKDDDVVYMAEDDGEGGAAEGGGSLPANIIAEEDGLYQIKGTDIYPVSHPDISTQPSVLPQRFGKEKIYEVLVSTEQEEIVSVSPSSYAVPSYTQTGPISSLNDMPQYAGDKIGGNVTVDLRYISEQFVFMNNESTVVTSYEGWFAISNPGYQLSTLTYLTTAIFVYPFYEDAKAYPGCFRYFAYSPDINSKDLYYAKIVTDSGGWHAENVTLEEIANDGVHVYDITLNPEIPSTATIIEASSFNSEACVPAICKKENGKWTITNNEDITPDFTLVRYIGEIEDYYYEYSGGSNVPTIDYVDLGLPSGTLWATTNVGASKPEDYGNYYAWGETSAKSKYDWSTYKWCNGTYNSMTKYCTSSSYGTVDNKSTLELSDDAAYFNLGSDWIMPTREQMQELIDNCTWTWGSRNGINGYRVTGTNGNSIFLPAAGWSTTGIYELGSNGYYWLSKIDTNTNHSACNLYFGNGGKYVSDQYRCYGRSVRPVRNTSN